MPLIALRSASNAALWSAFVGAFLDENAGHQGPGGFPAFAWLTHRIQRDALYRAAAEQGVRAWLGPPVAFLSALPRLFDIRLKPVGLLDRQHLIDTLARRHGEDIAAAGQSTFDRRGVGRALDGVIGELLAEGTTPDQLEQALGKLEGDAFAARRNAWVAAVYRDYRAGFEAEGRYDTRSIHALVAERIEQGGLAAALGGARRLHIYGLTTLRTRQRLMEALRAQREVEVMVYVPATLDADEWGAVADTVRDLAAEQAPSIMVQPAPDERRELDFVAMRIKHLLVRERVRPDRIAVIARTGREDARAAHETLTAAGIPTTARIRASFAEVPAIKAALLLFRGAALDWPYRVLRQVLASPYFDLDLDLRALDRIAGERRVTGLAGWAAALEGAPRPGEEPSAAERRRARAEAFRAFSARVAALSAPRSSRAWIAAVRELLDPGWFEFRRRVCRVEGDADARRAIVRLDQQGVTALSSLLREWEESEPDGEPITAREWHARFRRFLHAGEIGVGTPAHSGVQVLEAHEAALFPFDHAFVVHANDGEFPRRPGTNWLFTDDELSTLRVAGLPLADRDEALRRERMLWHAVTMGPRVTITYRTADPNGVPLLPSLMTPVHDADSTIPRTRFVWPEPVTAAHEDRAVLRDAVPVLGGGAMVNVPRLAPIQRAILAATAERLREGAPLGTWSGHLRDPAVLAAIDTRFGEGRIWSPSQLEGYAQNPFIFLLDRVLDLHETAEADEDTNALTFGSVVHTLLERFFRECGDAPPAVFDEKARKLFSKVAATVLAQEEASGEWLGLPQLWSTRKREIVSATAEFLAWERERNAARRPRFLEYVFGDDSQPQVWIEGRDVAGRTARLRVRGRIDRVDADTTGALHVIDYKSGSIPGPKGYADGGTLQGPLYLAALRAAGVGVPGSAVYLSVRNQKAGAEVEWGEEAVARALSIALSIPAHVRAGRFEPQAAASSDWKDYWLGADICRVTAVAEEGCCRFDVQEPADG